MATITITAGGKTGSYRGDPGVYAATLVTHEMIGPFKAKDPKPNEPLEYMMHEWGFSIEGADEGEEMVWWTSGESTGQKSRTFGIITALAGGVSPAVGQAIDTDRLIGRQVMVDVRKNDRGYLDVAGIMPMPRTAAKPAAAKAQPVAVADPDESGLPF